MYYWVVRKVISFFFFRNNGFNCIFSQPSVQPLGRHIYTNVYVYIYIYLFFILEIFFLILQNSFCLLPYQSLLTKCDIFQHFAIDKVKMVYKQEKSIECVWRKCIERRPMPKLVYKIAFRRFWYWRCTTFSKVSWSWQRQNNRAQVIQKDADRSHLSIVYYNISIYYKKQFSFILIRKKKKTFLYKYIPIAGIYFSQ